jgi:hypothetical protein
MEVPKLGLKNFQVRRTHPPFHFFIKKKLGQISPKNEVSSLQKYEVTFNGGFQSPEVRKEIFK